MRQKTVIIKAWLLAAALLAGCASAGQQSPGSGSSAAAAEETVSAEAEKEATGDAEAGAETTDDPETMPSEEEMPYIFPLLNEQALTLELVEALDVENGGRVFLIRSENRTEHDIAVNLDHIRLNDTIAASDRISIYPKAGQKETFALADLKEAVLDAEQEGITVSKITCVVYAESFERDEAGNRIVLFEETKEVVFPENFKPRQVCESTLSMRAEEQILREDDQVRITLMNLGKFVGSSDYYILQGILKVENLSDSTIPFEIQGVKLNGYYMEVSGTKKGDLTPGSAIYSGFSCSKADVEKAGITEVETVELLILTSLKENVGTIYSNAGGSWYPVLLAEHGTGAEDAGTGIPVYEDEYVSIEFCGAEMVWNEPSYAGGSGYGHYTWDFAFSNKTDKELRVSFDDFLIDGEPDTGGFADRYLLLCDLGANSRTKEAIWRSIKEERPLPEISFKVHIESAGGGRLFSISEEYVTITQEMLSN